MVDVKRAAFLTFGLCLGLTWDVMAPGVRVAVVAAACVFVVWVWLGSLRGGGAA